MSEPDALSLLVGQWFRVDLMGHQCFYGCAVAMVGTVMILEAPDIAGSETRGPIPKRSRIVNLGGPALHNAVTIDEAEALAALAAQRPYLAHLTLQLTDHGMTGSGRSWNDDPDMPERE